MAEIHRHRPVEFVRGYVGKMLLWVARRVVDQHGGRSKLLPRLGDRSLEVAGLGHIAAKEQRRMWRRGRERSYQRLAGLIVEIEEGDPTTVVGEGLDELLANAAGAAGNQDGSIPEALILRVTHAMSLHGRIERKALSDVDSEAGSPKLLADTFVGFGETATEIFNTAHSYARTSRGRAHSGDWT